MSGILIKEESEKWRKGNHVKVQTHRGDSHIKTEAEIRVMLPESQEHQNPPEFERGKEKSSCAFRVSMVLLPPPFLTSPELKKNNFFCYKPPSL